MPFVGLLHRILSSWGTLKCTREFLRLALCQGTTSVVPKRRINECGLQPLRNCNRHLPCHHETRSRYSRTDLALLRFLRSCKFRLLITLKAAFRPASNSHTLLIKSRSVGRLLCISYRLRTNRRIGAISPLLVSCNPVGQRNAAAFRNMEIPNPKRSLHWPSDLIQLPPSEDGLPQ